MAFYHIIVLSLIQGLTEFLPISSSGHLIIIPKFLGWSDQGLAMDVAVHIGTLLAVILYFYQDVWKIFKGFLTLIQGRLNEGGRLFLWLLVATLPAIAFGILVSHLNPPLFRTFIFVGWTTLSFAILLWMIDRMAPEINTLKTMTTFKSFLIGLAQALALMPGTSRSGICMTMGRFLGLKRIEAARFAFLLSIPTIMGAGVHTGLKLHLQGLPFLTETTLMAMGASCLFSLLAFNFMMRWLKRGNFTPFVIYRIALGLLLLTLGYGLTPY